MSRPLRYGELFAGAGGLSLGLDRAGLRCAFHAEIEDFPRRVLTARWPDVPLYGDVTRLDGAALVAAHGPIDLLSGGAPCQDLSVAGKRAGFSGTRSILFFELVRLWHETQATYCLYENVAGALSSNNGADFAAVLSALVGATVAVPRDGWGGDESGGGVATGPRAVAAWRLLDAQWFGVPQRRLRVFVLAARAGGCDPAEVLLEPHGVRRDSPPRREAREAVAADVGAGVASESGPGWWSADGGVGPLRASPGGQPSHVAFDWQNAPAQTMRVSGDSTDPLRTNTTPAVLAFDTTQITNKDNRSNPQPGDPCHPLASTAHLPVVCVTGEVTHALTHEGHDASEDGTGRGTPIVFNETGHEKWTEERIAGSLNAHEAREAHTIVADREIASTLIAGGRETGPHGALDGQNLVVGTLTSTDGGMDVDRVIGNQIGVTAGIPRRLMPVECERLMSWPDGWTDVPDEKGKPASDSARYKACGNGVVSNVAEWIGARLIAVHASMRGAA